jgi:hypothetical protein
MKRLLVFIAGIIVVSMLSSCEKEEEKTPVPAFKISVEYAHVNEDVTFQNLSQNAINYEWDFADGTTSTEKNPTHIFTETGHYMVKLFAIANSLKSYAVSSIDIFPPEGVYEGTTSDNEDIRFSISENNITNFETYIRDSYGSAPYFTSNFGEMSFVNNSIQAISYPNDTMTFSFEENVITGMIVFGDYDLDSQGNITDKLVSFQAAAIHL